MSDTPHAARRWAHTLLAIIESDEDVRTMDAWAQRAGISASQLRTYCGLVGVSAKDSLDFARLLRAVLHNQDRNWSLPEVLDCSDPRTIARLLSRAGFVDLPRGNAESFVMNQTLIRNEVLRVQVLLALGAPA